MSQATVILEPDATSGLITDLGEVEKSNFFKTNDSIFRFSVKKLETDDFEPEIKL